VRGCQDYLREVYRVADVDEENLCQMTGVMRRMVSELHPQFRTKFVIGSRTQQNRKERWRSHSNDQMLPRSLIRQYNNGVLGSVGG
jgi:hypothetical protein